MEKSYTNRFLLLDFGYPMTTDIITSIKISLQNILTLAAVFSPHSRLFDFGISVLNSTFMIKESTASLKKKFNLIYEKLDNLDKITKIEDKVTVQEYKYFLTISLKIIFNEFEKNVKNGPSSSQKQEAQIRVTVITKKTASLLSNILMDVIEKLNKNFLNTISEKNFGIIQIINEKKNVKVAPKKAHLINWTTCLNNLYDLECVFKEWLIKTDCEQQQIGIILCEDSNLIVKCEVEDCIVNPNFSSIGQKSGFSFKDAYEFLLLDSMALINNNLKILFRIPISGLCPTLVYGTPRRLYATCDLNMNESLANLQIFKELCRELLQLEQGLLLKWSFPRKVNEVNCYLFITSNGDTLLLNTIAPNELYLPQHSQFLKPDFQIDQNVTAIVKGSLQKMHFLKEYHSSDFSSGLYEYIRNYLIQPVKTSSFLEHIDPVLKLGTENSQAKIWQIKNRKFNFSTKRKKLSKGVTEMKNKKLVVEEKKILLLTKSLKNDGQDSLVLKRQKLSSEIEDKNIHPALLPSDIVEKCRRGHPSFHLPELSHDYYQNLI